MTRFLRHRGLASTQWSPEWTMLFLIVPLTYGYMLERYIRVEFPPTVVAWYT